jgi:hypothetical protein
VAAPSTSRGSGEKKNAGKRNRSQIHDFLGRRQIQNFLDGAKIVGPPSASRGSGEKKNAGKRNRSQIQIGVKQKRAGKEIKKKIVRKSSSKKKDGTKTKSSLKKVVNKTKGKAKIQQGRHHRRADCPKRQRTYDSYNDDRALGTVVN